MKGLYYRQPSRKKILLIGLVVFVAGLLAAGGFNVALHATNTTEFCTSCHSMQTNFEEMKGKPHWSSRTGVHAGCADCHVPKDFLPKMYAKIMAAKDVWHHLIGTIDTPEKYEAYRLNMAERVWAKMKANDSRECRSCHSFEHMDFSLQDKFSRKKHEKAPDRGETCIDCHKGIAHKLPEEPAAEPAAAEPAPEPPAAGPPAAGEAPAATPQPPTAGDSGEQAPATGGPPVVTEPPAEKPGV